MAQALSITVPLGVPIFFLVAVAFGSLGTVLGFSTEASSISRSPASLHFVWGRYCNYRASKAMGANLVAPVQQGNLLVTLALAIWILGEHLTPLRVLGIVLVVLGPALTYERTRGKTAEAKTPDTLSPARRSKPNAHKVFQPNYAEGYLFALLSSTGYGISPVLVRLALENRESRGQPRRRPDLLHRGDARVCADPAVARAMATRALARPRSGEMVRDLRRLRLLRADAALHGAGARAGVGGDADPADCRCCSGSISAASSIPQHEVFGGRIVAATVVSLAGALALSVSTEIGAVAGAAAGLGQDVPQLALAVTGKE